LDTDALQAVELGLEGERLVLRRSVREPLPAGAFTDGELTDAGAIAEAVRRTFRSHRLPRRNVSVALGGRLAIARVIETTETSEAEADQMLQDRLARYAIYEGREILWKASALETEGTDHRAYLAAAVPADHIRTLLPTLRRAGIHVSYLEPYALSLLRSLSAWLGDDSRPAVLLALHSGSADFLIAKAARPLLVRSIEVGTGELAQRPQSTEDILVEARRSIEFCRTRFSGDRPRLRLCMPRGQHEDVAGPLLGRLQRELDSADVEALPAWPDVTPDAGADGAGQAWTAIGAAMVGLGRDGPAAHLNLVPADWAEIEKIQKSLMGVVASVGLAILVTVGIMAAIRLATGDTAKKTQATSAEVAANTATVRTVSALRRQAAEAAARAKLWQEIRGHVRPYDWAAGLDAIMSQIPEGVRVGQVAYGRGLIRITGEAQSADLLHQLVQRLGRLPCLEEANLERLVRAPAPGGRLLVYTISCRFSESAVPPPRKEPQP
jgi:Tfp pilus assembly PilM family ATPase/Tfp pilus assembly protein PilN